MTHTRIFFHWIKLSGRIRSFLWFLGWSAALTPRAEATSFFPTPELGGGCVQAPVGIENWWPGDGSPVDIQTTTNATLRGTVGFAPGLIGQAFDFDGKNGAVKTIVAASSVDEWAMASWVLWRGPSASPGGKGEAIFYHGNTGTDGYGLFVVGPDWCKEFVELCDHAGELAVLYGGVRWFTTDLTLARDAWTHVALVRSETILKLYINGKLAWFRATVHPIAPAPPMSISLEQPLTFKGLVDEVAIFSKPLNEAILGPIVEAGSFGMCKGPEFTRATKTRTGQVEFETKGPRNRDVIIWISSDLITWEAVVRLPNPTGTLTFGAPVNKGAPRRFYRLGPAN